MGENTNSKNNEEYCLVTSSFMVKFGKSSVGKDETQYWLHCTVKISLQGIINAAFCRLKDVRDHPPCCLLIVQKHQPLVISDRVANLCTLHG